MISTMALLAAAATVNFGNEVGKIRPELHSSGFAPQICSCSKESVDLIRSMGFTACRTHDWALTNPNQRVCDYFHIFPLIQLDANDPANYVFGPTDYLLGRARNELGADIFFRLGTPDVVLDGTRLVRAFKTVVLHQMSYSSSILFFSSQSFGDRST